MERMPLWEIILIFSTIVLALPILICLGLPLFKASIKKKSYIYLYSLSAGFILALGVMGLISHSINHMRKEWHDNYSGWAIPLVAISGIIIGMTGSLLTRHLLVKYSGELHQNHKNHKHDDHIFNISETGGKKHKTMIVLLGFHKIPAGITMGMLISRIPGASTSFEWLPVIAFVLHMIPEILVIYYRYIQTGTNKWRACFNTISINLMMIPMIFVGAYLGDFIDTIHWIRPLILIISGAVLVFTAIVELIPEFIDHSISHGKWHKTLLLFTLGFTLAILILIFHTH